MNLFLKTIALCFGGCFFAFGQAQKKDTSQLIRLKEVVLTDLKSPINANYKGATQLLITAENLLPFRTRGIAAALNSLAGIEVNGARSTMGAVIGVYARGGRGRQALIIIDGVRAADPASASLSFDLRLLDLSNIETIKVIKGANSSLYGTNAGTIVIDIVTKKAANKKVALLIGAAMGTHQSAKDQNNQLNYLAYNTMFSGTQQGWQYSVAYNTQQARGLSSYITEGNKEDPFDQKSMRAHLEKAINPSFKMGGFFSRNQMKAHYDDAYLGVDAENSFETLMNSIGIQTQLKLKNSLLNSQISWASYDTKDLSAYGNELLAESVNAELLYRYFFNAKWNFISGINILNDKIKANIEQGTKGSDYLIADSFLSLNYVGNIFNLNLGGRYNHHSVYKGQWVYHLQPTLILTEKTRFHAAYSSAYITPALGMFFGPYGANTELRPETNTNVELGLSYELSEDLQIGLTFFNRKETNAIIFNSPAFLYQNNPNETKVRGLEMQWFANITSKLGINMNYSWVAVPEQTIRIPTHKANGALRYKLGSESQLSILYAYVGNRLDTDFTNYKDQTLNDFSLVDMQYNFTLGFKGVQGFLSVNNLLNKEYIETIGYETLGRNISLGFDWKL